jgi:hypothetical protein
MTRKKKFPLRDRAKLARRVYNAVYYGKESFELEDVGADLAYLMGAILRRPSNSSFCVWPENRPIVRLLRTHFHADHRIWLYVHIEDEPDTSEMLTMMSRPIVLSDPDAKDEIETNSQDDDLGAHDEPGPSAGLRQGDETVP